MNKNTIYSFVFGLITPIIILLLFFGIFCIFYDQEELGENTDTVRRGSYIFRYYAKGAGISYGPEYTFPEDTVCLFSENGDGLLAIMWNECTSTVSIGCVADEDQNKLEIFSIAQEDDGIASKLTIGDQVFKDLNLDGQSEILIDGDKCKVDLGNGFVPAENEGNGAYSVDGARYRFIAKGKQGWVKQ